MKPAIHQSLDVWKIIKPFVEHKIGLGAIKPEYHKILH